MKTKFCLLLLLISISSFAQRFGYVDTSYILKKLPSYLQAQERLNRQADSWEKEIENHKIELENMIVSLNNEKIILTKEKITEREEKIEAKRKAISELEQKYYGPEGELIKAQINYIKPIQNEIYNIVNQVAKRRNYSFIFDKGNGDLIMLYSDPKYDISEEVLRKLKEK